MTRRIEYAFLFAVLALALAAFCVFSRVALADGSGNENTANQADQGAGDEGSGEEGSGDEGSGDEGAGNEGQALGFSQGQETEIQVGSVVGSATLRDSMCVIHTPIKIGARVQNGSSPLRGAGVSMNSAGLSFMVNQFQGTLAHTAPAARGFRRFISRPGAGPWQACLRPSVAT